MTEDPRFWLEMVGYAGSILVAISLMMKSLLRLRIINLIGALVFVFYGLLIKAYPVSLLNGIIVAIDLYYLIQMLRQKDFFTLLEVSPDSTYLQRFLEFYQPEIAVIFPEYPANITAGRQAVFVLRNMVPAGLLIFAPEGRQARVLLDYVIPGYRDFRVGKFLFDENAAYFAARGIQQLVSASGSPLHTRYLQKMGFQFKEGVYLRTLNTPVIQDAHL